MSFTEPAPLSPAHDATGFSCGVASLDIWIDRHAPTATAAGSARVFVTFDDETGKLGGYHALALGAIDHEVATVRAARGMPQHAIPAMVLARLAVDSRFQGRGLAAMLLRDAMVRTLAIADHAGVRILLAHAISEEARDFYLHFGFEPSPTDGLNLQLLVKDIRRALDEL